MGKRKYQGSSSRSKKLKLQPWDIDLSKATKMIAATCHSNSEGRCQQELALAFQQIADKYYPTEPEKTSEEKEAVTFDISKGLEAELEKCSRKSTQSRVQFIRAPRGQAFIHLLDNTLDPGDLVMKFFEGIQNGQEIGKYVVRLIPLNTCYAKIDKLQKLVTELISKHDFKDEDKTYAVNLRRRNNEKVGRDEAIDLVVKEMPSRFSVDLKNPDVVILVNVNARIAGACILDGKLFTTYHNFNVEKFKATLDRKQEDTKDDCESDSDEPQFDFGATANQKPTNVGTNGITPNGKKAASNQKPTNIRTNGIITPQGKKRKLEETNDGCESDSDEPQFDFGASKYETNLGKKSKFVQKKSNQIVNRNRQNKNGKRRVIRKMNQYNNMTVLRQMPVLSDPATPTSRGLSNVEPIAFSSMNSSDVDPIAFPEQNNIPPGVSRALTPGDLGKEIMKPRSFDLTTPKVASRRLNSSFGSPACSPMTRVLSDKKAFFRRTSRNKAQISSSPAELTETQQKNVTLQNAKNEAIQK